MIEVIGGKLFQWDTGRVARVIPSNGVTIHEVHFAAYGMKYAYVVETYEKDGAVLCSVPNAILQQDKRILCYEVTRTDTGEMSVSSTPLSLAPRSKPQDYVYTEDELKNYDRLESLTEEKLATLKHEFSGTVGDLKNLNTTDKSNLVAAINEAAQSGASVQSDWNQNDETAADYVKNRPFYTGDPEKVIVFPETTVSFSYEDGLFGANLSEILDLTLGKKYTVNWDGTEYDCVCSDISGVSIIGNQSILGLSSNTNEPFIFYNIDTCVVATTESLTEHTISVSIIEQPNTKIDEKYLPIATHDNYGVVKISEIVTPYYFDVSAPHDEMVKAITDFNKGRANIVLGGQTVIRAYYNSNNDTVSLTRSFNPLITTVYENVDGYYNVLSTTSTTEYNDVKAKRILIFSIDNKFYSVIYVRGAQDDVKLHIYAEHLYLNTREMLNEKELYLKSSTTNSTKEFRITVDDSGTLSATEVE